MPCPENLIKNIAKNKKDIDDILEKKKQENDNSKITYIENLKILMSSIFLPSHINNKLLHKVADA